MYDISITYSYFTKLGNCPRKRRHLSHKTTSLCCNIYFLVTTYRRHTVITAIIMVMVNFLSSFPQSSQGVHYNTCIPISLSRSTILMLLLMTMMINVQCKICQTLAQIMPMGESNWFLGLYKCFLNDKKATFFWIFHLELRWLSVYIRFLFFLISYWIFITSWVGRSTHLVCEIRYCASHWVSPGLTTTWKVAYSADCRYPFPPSSFIIFVLHFLSPAQPSLGEWLPG